MFDRDLHGGHIARLVVRALELRRPCHRSNNHRASPLDALPMAIEAARKALAAQTAAGKDPHAQP